MSQPLIANGPHDLRIDLGTVTTMPMPGNAGAFVRVITPPQTQPINQVITWLEHPAHAAELDDTPFLEQEARAATVVCFRWGSYFALLSDPVRPLWAAATHTKSNVWRITNEEMWRLNLEVSSGLATWLDLRDGDQERYRRIVAAALRWLPLEGQLRPVWGRRYAVDALVSLATPPPEGWRDVPHRAFGNILALHTVRNRLESIHDGAYMPVPLGERRLRPDEVRSIVEHTVSSLYGMISISNSIMQNAWPDMPRLDQLGLLLNHTYSPMWSLTDETRRVELDEAEPAPTATARCRAPWRS